MWPKSAKSNMYAELEILQSEALLEQTVKRLDLARDPEFNEPRSRNWAEILASFEFVWPIAGFIRSWSGDAPKDDLAVSDNLRVATSRLRDNLRIDVEGTMPGGGFERSYAGASLEVASWVLSSPVRISVRSVDPRKAARIANVFANIYITDFIERQVWRVEENRAKTELRKRELLTTLSDSERAVEQFMLRKRLSENGDNVLARHQMSALGSQFASALIEHAEKSAHAVRTSPHPVPGENSVVPPVIEPSPTMRRLRDKETTLRRYVARLGRHLGDRHPKLIEARTVLSDLRHRIHDERGRRFDELDADRRIAAAKLLFLNGKLEKLEKRRLENVADAIRLRQLQGIANVKPPSKSMAGLRLILAQA